MRFWKMVAWVLCAFAAVCVLLAGLVLMDGTKDTKPALGFLMLAILAGIPGGGIMWRVVRRERRDQERQRLRGYLRTFDRFTATEIAQKLGRNELDAEHMIIEVNGTDGLDLAFHRATRQFVHKNRLGQGEKIVTRCPSCGASAGNELVLANETPKCTYCGALLT